MLRRIVYSLVLIPVVFVTACKHKAPGNKDALKGRWYKRYTGTIAGQPVVANIYSYGDNTADGTYYYANKSEVLYISLEIDSANVGHIEVTESVITDRPKENEEADEDSRMENVWDVTFNDDHITGKFYKDKGAPTYDIDLHEDYSNAYPLDMVRYDDSVKAQKVDEGAIVSWMGVVPSAKMAAADADFINRGILQLMKNERMVTLPDISETKDFQHKYLSAYLTQYGQYVEKLKNGTETADPNRRFEQYLEIVPMYNDKGMLVLANQWYDYSGGAHGNHGSSYINIDVRDKKIWKTEDVLHADSTAISKLLDEEARSKFHMGKTDTISNFLNAERVPVSSNIIIADKGITFCYSTMEIATIPEGDIKFFIPYNKLKPLLKAEFVARMGLKL